MGHGLGLAELAKLGLQLRYGTVAPTVADVNGMGVKSLRMGLSNPYPLAEGQVLWTATPTAYRQAKKVKAEIDGKPGVIEST
jgi:hypothetical protein